MKPSQRLATAILDQPPYRCEVIAINGTSYRLDDRPTTVEGPRSDPD